MQRVDLQPNNLFRLAISQPLRRTTQPLAHQAELIRSAFTDKLTTIQRKITNFNRGFNTWVTNRRLETVLLQWDTSVPQELKTAGDLEKEVSHDIGDLPIQNIQELSTIARRLQRDIYETEIEGTHLILRRTGEVTLARSNDDVEQVWRYSNHLEPSGADGSLSSIGIINLSFTDTQERIRETYKIDLI